MHTGRRAVPAARWNKASLPAGTTRDRGFGAACEVNVTQRFSTDILIIGGGAAGLSAALHLSPHARVTVLCKGSADTGSSHWAQGGVAAVTDPEDSFESHIDDTLSAGAGLCDREIVEFTVSRAPEAIRPPDGAWRRLRHRRQRVPPDA